MIINAVSAKHGPPKLPHLQPRELWVKAQTVWTAADRWCLLLLFFVHLQKCCLALTCAAWLLSLFSLQLILTPHKHSLFPLWTHFHITHLNELWQTPNGFFTCQCCYVCHCLASIQVLHKACWWETAACSNNSPFQRIRGWWTWPTSWDVPLSIPVSLSTLPLLTDIHAHRHTHLLESAPVVFVNQGSAEIINGFQS